MSRKRFCLGAAVLTMLAAYVSSGSADSVPPAAVSIGGVTWLSSLSEAQTKAKETGKPILHFQLLGRLDDEFC